MVTSECARGVPEHLLPRLAGRTALRLTPRLTRSLLREDAPDADAAERRAAARAVRSGVTAMPDVLRAGVGVAARAVQAGMLLTAGHRFARMPAADRARHAQRLARADLPVAAEFVRLARGLGLAELYERRTPEMIRRAAEQEEEGHGRPAL